MIIREADADHPADRAGIRAVVLAAFEAEPGVADVVEELRTTRRAVVELVAVDGEAVVGQVGLSRGWVDDEEQLVPALVLSPLGVLPARQRAGTGGRLVAAALEAARARGEAYVFLEGSPAYYGAHGFSRASDHGFVRPTERIPDAAFQVAVLEDRGARGRVVYPDAFWVHDAAGLRGDALDRVREALGE